MPKFKGGNVTLKCGGLGPDDYVFKVLPNGRYYKVVCPTDRAVYNFQRAAMTYVMRNRPESERLCLSDAQAVLARRPDMQTLTFWEFANRFGGADFQKQIRGLLDDVRGG